MDSSPAASAAETPACSQAEARPRDNEDRDPPLYCTDEFRIYYMKVLPCSKRYCHDWTTCPFAHPGEKARRRDPRTSNYTGIACPDMKKDGVCIRGELCPYAHNVFEYWLHPTRYRTQLCNDGTNCRRRVCFFAHTLGELRVPSSKPFVNPQALAAASQAAGARRSGLSLESLAGDIAKLRSGQTVAEPSGAAELASRLAGIQLSQQQQLQQPHPAMGQSADQKAVVMQLLSNLLQQKIEQNRTAQQAPPAIQQQVPSQEELAALYNSMAQGGNLAAMPAPEQLPQLHSGNLNQQDIAALLATVDPSGQVSAELLAAFTGKSISPDGHGHGPTPRSSLDVSGMRPQSEYSSARSSFDVPQIHTPRGSIDMQHYALSRGASDRSSFDSRSIARGSSDYTRRSSISNTSSYNQDFHQYPDHGFQLPTLNSAPSPFETSSPLAFTPGGAYFLTGASQTTSGFPSSGGLLLDQGLQGGFDQRSVSLPTYLPNTSGLPSQNTFQNTLPGLQEGVPFDARRMSSEYPAGSSLSFDNGHGGQEQAAKPPLGARRFSLDNPQQGRSNSFQQHLMGALPGSFNYGTFKDETSPQTLTTLSGSSNNSGDGLFANNSLSAADTEVPRPIRPRSLNLGSLYESTAAPGSRPSSGAAGRNSPQRNIWSAAGTDS